MVVYISFPLFKNFIPLFLVSHFLYQPFFFRFFSFHADNPIASTSTAFFEDQPMDSLQTMTMVADPDLRRELSILGTDCVAANVPVDPMVDFEWCHLEGEIAKLLED